ncbi:MAG: hypothetical protein NZ805_13240 [Armatimonadetes bacterium]|nr:hypothetical protein [Armatimonadota bacterium]MDW8029202.1 hypothetical protein [Armatimonadota bacterium]
MAKENWRKIALLLLLVLTTFAAVEITGALKERAKSVPCGADGCGDCLCCMPPAVVSLKTINVTKTDEQTNDNFAVLLPLPMLLPQQICQPNFFANLKCFSLSLSFTFLQRAPPASV